MAGGGGCLLVEFLEWWGGQLRDLVPAHWLTQPGGADALIADVSVPGILTMRRRRGGMEQRLTELHGDDAGSPGLRAAVAGRPRGEPVLLRVAPAIVLERAVSLPLAAERDLVRVLGYEMERLTPFAASELVWDHLVLLRDRARGRINLRLTMVQLAAVAQPMAMLQGLGVVPAALEAAMPDGMRVLKLTHEGRPAQARLSIRSLAIAAGVLAALAIASPFLRQALHLAALRAQMDSMAPRIAQVEALRQRIAGSSAGGDAVAAETRRLGDTLEAIAALTEVLPDDSYLTEFTMRERKMTMAGLGASAPRLISGLSADPRLRSPAFTAPVTKSETNHLDVFAIRAELAQ